jgi:hypothetical protein
MRLSSHSKFPLEFLSEPPFRSYAQSNVSTKKKNTDILPQNTDILPGCKVFRTAIATPRERRRTKIF